MIMSTPGNNSASDLVNWIVDPSHHFGDEAVEAAKAAFIDTVGCILAGVPDPATQRAFASIPNTRTGTCTIAGRSARLCAEDAAFVNGTAAHALDYDDNFLPAVTHASAVLVPALLALGQEVDASGGALLDAYIVGLEAQAWLGCRLIPQHYSTGWHATSTIGAIGSAAASARLLSFDSETALAALSIATSMAGGSKNQFGTMMKPIHAGLAAQTGITAARLAATGISANSEPFDGPWGFVALHHGSKAGAPAEPGALSILRDGLAQKRFPCCASSHRTLDAIVALRAEHGITADSIEVIETVIPDSNYRNLPFASPGDEKEARFSMQYCASVAAIHGHVCLDDFAPDAVQRDYVRNFLPRIHMKSAGPQSNAVDGIWDCPALTTIRLRDGQTFEKEIHWPVGTIHVPLSPLDLAAKFQECAQTTLDSKNASSLLKRLRNFESEEVRAVSALMQDKSATNAGHSHFTGFQDPKEEIKLGGK